MESDFKRQIERALMPSPGNFGPNPDIQIRHNPERAIITSTATASSYIESHLKKAGFDFAVEGAKGAYNPLAKAYYRYTFTVFPKEHNTYGSQPIFPKPSGVREIEASNLKRNVCSYLKQKIAQEEQESQTYHKIETDAQTLTNGHIFLDVLFDAQATEVKELKTLYKDLCAR